jgi:hypothetical protein
MSDEHSIEISQSETSFNKSVTRCAASIKLHHHVIVLYEYSGSGAARCNIG